MNHDAIMHSESILLVLSTSGLGNRTFNPTFLTPNTCMQTHTHAHTSHMKTYMYNTHTRTPTPAKSRNAVGVECRSSCASWGTGNIYSLLCPLHIFLPFYQVHEFYNKRKIHVIER